LIHPSEKNAHWKQNSLHQNLRRFLKVELKRTGENMRQFAERIDVPYGWLRRVSTKGLSARPNGNKADHYIQLAEAFGIEPMTLWSKHRTLDIDQVFWLLKRDYPRQWALLVAWEWSREEGNGELLAEQDIRKSDALQGSCAEEVARWLADEIDQQFEVVSLETSQRDTKR
jgi:hypothetical protein